VSSRERKHDTPPKSPLGAAIAYANNQWKAATRFLDDPHLPVDNNATERALRVVALGRKNFCGAGSKAGGQALAVLYSLMRISMVLSLLWLSACASTGGVAPVHGGEAPEPTGVDAAAGEGPSEELVYGGAPLHPSCVTQVEGEGGLDITACASRTEEVHEQSGRLRSYPPPMDEFENGGLDEYVVLGRYGDGIVVQYVFNGGGTGNFSGVMILALHGTRLTRLARLEGAGGDRCNGGLTRAEVVREGDAVAIEYTMNLTPPDVLELSAAGRALGMRAYDDLEASALSCVGTATYRYVDGDATLVGVLLDEAPIVDQEGWTEDYPRQSCFNALANERIREGSRQLGPAELEAFAEAFGARCGAPPAP